jgi:hypothetical protein
VHFEVTRKVESSIFFDRAEALSVQSGRKLEALKAKTDKEKKRQTNNHQQNKTLKHRDVITYQTSK